MINIIIMKKFKTWRELPEYDSGTGSEPMLLEKKGTNRLAQHTVNTNFCSLWGKQVIAAKCSKE